MWIPIEGKGSTTAETAQGIDLGRVGQFGPESNKSLPALKNGRPLQNQLQTGRNGFVEAGPSHAFRDGPAMFVVKLIHYQ